MMQAPETQCTCGSLGFRGKSGYGDLYGYLLPSLAREYIYSYEVTVSISCTCLMLSILDDSMVVKCSEHLATSCLCHVVLIPSQQELKSRAIDDTVCSACTVGGQPGRSPRPLELVAPCEVATMPRSTKGLVLGWQPGAGYW